MNKKIGIACIVLLCVGFVVTLIVLLLRTVTKPDFGKYSEVELHPSYYQDENVSKENIDLVADYFHDRGIEGHPTAYLTYEIECPPDLALAYNASECFMILYKGYTINAIVVDGEVISDYDDVVSKYNLN